MGVNLRRERMVFASSELKFLYSQHLALFQRACALSQGFDDAVSELTRGLTLTSGKPLIIPAVEVSLVPAVPVYRAFTTDALTYA